MMTFILFFAFVVNTGMLVNAKINLQNAADLAAYSGAAAQARQLNTISYLNYEMRRQYKKFLFRYYVVGNMAQAKFPKTGGGSKGGYQWSPDGTAIYGVPAVCIIFDSKVGSNDNYCQLAYLPALHIPSTNAVLDSFDLINSTLNQQLQQIEKIRQANCGSIANANLSVLMLWLFNTDPNFQRLPNIAANPNSPDLPNIINVSRAIANGLGLIPREIILHERINTLASYVNSPAQTGVTHDRLAALEGGQDPASNERTIQAFLSAYYTLGEHTFSDTGSIEMDELLPSGANSLLNLNLVQQDIDTYAVRYVAQVPGQTVVQEILPNGSTTPANCVPRLQAVTVHQIPLGVSKDPTTMTYYAIRLKATAKVMFSPFGDMQLKAYAAARPFGSRIGPAAAYVQSQFAYSGAPNSQYSIQNISNSLANMIPNLQISQDEPATASSGWNDVGILGSMYEQIFGGAPPAGGAVQQSQFEQGIEAAMAPNPIEGNLYNIINDLGTDQMVKFFDTQDEATFWAPVVSPAQQSNLSSVLQNDITQLFSGVGATNAGAQQATLSGLQATLTQDIIQYATTLQSGAGESAVPEGPGESINLVRLQDPLPKSANGQPIAIPGVTLVDPGQLRTSFVNTNDSTIKAGGRVGYSVKFVSFDSLLNPVAADGLSGVPTNTKAIQNDAEAGEDVQAIKH